jgi:hypothetical protein
MISSKKMRFILKSCNEFMVNEKSLLESCKSFAVISGGYDHKGEA